MKPQVMSPRAREIRVTFVFSDVLSILWLEGLTFNVRTRVTGTLTIDIIGTHVQRIITTRSCFSRAATECYRRKRKLKDARPARGPRELPYFLSLHLPLFTRLIQNLLRLR